MRGATLIISALLAASVVTACGDGHGEAKNSQSISQSATTKSQASQPWNTARCINAWNGEAGAAERSSVGVVAQDDAQAGDPAPPADISWSGQFTAASGGVCTLVVYDATTNESLGFTYWPKSDSSYTVVEGTPSPGRGTFVPTISVNQDGTLGRTPYSSPKTSVSAATRLGSSPKLQRCVDVWNQDGMQWRSRRATVLIDARTVPGYPIQKGCLVVVDGDDSFGDLFPCWMTSSGSYQCPEHASESSAVEPALIRWNASIDQKGHLELTNRASRPVSSPSALSYSENNGYVLPFDSSGVLRTGLTITGDLSGQCSFGSESVTVANGLRCFSGNLVLDPCFAQFSEPIGQSVKHGVVVFCPRGAGSTRFTRLTVGGQDNATTAPPEQGASAGSTSTLSQSSQGAPGATGNACIDSWNKWIVSTQAHAYVRAVSGAEVALIADDNGKCVLLLSKPSLHALQAGIGFAEASPGEWTFLGGNGGAITAGNATIQADGTLQPKQ